MGREGVEWGRGGVKWGKDAVWNQVVAINWAIARLLAFSLACLLACLHSLALHFVCLILSCPDYANEEAEGAACYNGGFSVLDMKTQ